MELTLYQVDAFSATVFNGNPAAICPLDRWLSDEKMQKIAAENNLAETAFFLREGEDYFLRWFTPAMEVDLCGHATLASAHVLFEHLAYAAPEIRFHSRSGLLTVRRDGDRYLMDFPAQPPRAVGPHPSLLPAFNVAPREVMKSVSYYFLVFANQEEIKDLQPDFLKLMKVEDAIGVICTAPGKGYDFVSRFFAPRAGINEDPVTGSAHCSMIPYWADRLGKQTLTAAQISPDRLGELWCEAAGERVKMGGHAATYLQGTIYI